MAVFQCICTNQRCGHEPGERCGKPVNEEYAKSYYSACRDTLTESGGWICDECWERVGLLISRFS